MFQRVLVPIDGSISATAAIQALRVPLERLGAEIVVLHVVEPSSATLAPHPWAFAVHTESAYVSADALVADAVDELTQLGLTAAGRVLTGDPPMCIARAAREMDATSVLMATRGQSGIMRWATGSVTERTLRSVDVPVLVVRTPSEEADGVAPNSEDLPRHALLPIDASSACLDVAPVLRRLTRGRDTLVTVVHFLSNYVGKAGMRRGGRYVARAQRRLRALGIQVRTRLMRGDPVAGITSFGTLSVCDPPVDLIVMSSHGRSGPSRWMRGSVTESVLRQTTVPMLVVRRAETVPPLA